MHDAGIMVPILFIMSAAAVFIVHLPASHRERMIIVEKGLTGEEIKAMYMREAKRDPLQSLKWGLLFILGGVALMLGIYLHETFFVPEGVIVGMVFLFVGLGLLLFYGIAMKRAA